MRSGALASAPAAFPLKSRLTLRRFGVPPKPAPQQQQRSAGALAGGFRGPLAARRAGFPRPGAAPRPAAARAPRPWGAHLSLAASGTPIGTPRDGQESPRNHEAGPKEAPKDGRRLPHDGPKRSPREPTVLLPIPCLNAAGAPLGSERIMAGKFRGCVYCTASAAASAGGSFRRGPR